MTSAGSDELASAVTFKQGLAYRPSLLRATLHLAGASKATALDATRIVAEDVRRYLDGEPLPHVANPDGSTPQRSLSGDARA